MLSNDTIQEALTALATMKAHKCLVERIVIGENNFDNREDTQWPNSRLDRSVANYFRFFRESYLPHEIADEDLEFRAAAVLLNKFLKACEEEDESKILKYGTLFFDGHVKQKTPKYLKYASIIEETYKELSAIDKINEAKVKGIASLKSVFSLKDILASYRKIIAEIFLESNFKLKTLEANIDVIIYATLLLTEKYLQEEGIKIPELQSTIWEPCGFFCDFWFAATLPDKAEKSEAVRQFYEEMSEQWPEYIANAMYILDYAAIIQDRLFSNRYMNPAVDWGKESFKIWNSYAAAALRLGEIFSKYKNKLPFMDDDIIKSLRERQRLPNPLIITEGKTDWKHIKNALRYFHENAQYTELKLNFHEYECDNMGGAALLGMCREYAKIPHNRKIIFIADSDDEKIVKQLGASSGEQYKSWENNVFSFCLPVPSHRKKYKNISIEFYYSDEEVRKTDGYTRKRLFFSNEVEKVVKSNLTNKKNSIEYCICPEIQEDEFNKKIYDNCCERIIDEHGKKVAHSKAVFADYVYQQRLGYNNFNLDEFKAIFVIIQAIVANTN